MRKMLRLCSNIASLGQTLQVDLSGGALLLRAPAGRGQVAIGNAAGELQLADPRAGNMPPQTPLLYFMQRICCLYTALATAACNLHLLPVHCIPACTLHLLPQHMILIAFGKIGLLCFI